MEFKKDSWHYKLYKIVSDGYPPSTTNLCAYFWKVVFGLFSIAIGCVFGLTLLGLIGFVFYKFTLYSFAGLGILLLLIALLVIRDRRPYNREPGLVYLYLKAKKDKVCPIITFVNSDNG